jgi:hypothetical protein
MAKLQVEVGADIGELKDKLAEAQLLLEKLRKQKATDIKLGLDVKNLQTQINDAKASINGLSKEITKNSSAMETHSRATANGGNTLMQFSRIAQDAPFGIIGIGNNLTATAESFGHLAKSSGGAGNALKAVGASLIGPGGILLAISLVTTGFTVLAQKGLTLSDVFNMMSGNFDQAAQDIKKAYEESTKSALGEVASIKSVIAIAKDETTSRRERLAAVDELQSKYPAYFGNLSNEQIMYGDLSGEIDKVTQSLINKSVAEKLSDKAGDALLKQLQINYKMIEAKKDLAQAEKEYEIIRNQGYTTGLDAAGKNLVKQGLIVKGLRAEWLAVNSQIKQYQNVINAFAKTDISEKATEDEIKAEAAAQKARLAEQKRAAAERAREAEKERKKELEELEKYNKSVLDGQNRLAAASAFAKSAEYNNQKEQRQQALDEAAKDIQAHEDFLANVGKTEAVKRSEQEQAAYSARLAQLNKFLAQKLITQQEYDALVFEAAKNTNETLRQFDRDAYNLVTGSIADTFGQLGAVIGNALATGGNVLNSMGRSLLQGLGRFISEMGSLLIQYGTMAVVKGKLDLAMKKGGKFAVAAGFIAIGVGVAAKAVGAVMSAKANAGIAGGESAGGTGQRGSFASGADVSSPVSSVSSGGSFNNSGGTVVFEISGQKLIGVLNNTTQGNLRLGGGGLVG